MELPEIRVYSADGRSPVSVNLPPPSYSGGRSSVSSAGGGGGRALSGPRRSSATSPQLCNVSLDEHNKRAGKVCYVNNYLTAAFAVASAMHSIGQNTKSR